MDRRPRGTGGVTSQSPDRHRIRWRDAEGKQRERIVAGTRAEASRLLQVEIAKVSGGGSAVGRQDETVGDWLESWLLAVKPGLQARSYQNYAHTVHNHLDPALGRKRLKGLTEDHIDAAVEAWRQAGASDSAVRWRINILRMALGVAVRRRRLGFNAALSVNLPEKRRARPVLPADDVLDRLLEAVKGHPYELAFGLVIGTGMRPGEILALRWRDIDWPRREINVTLSRIYGTDIVKVPKTQAGDRVFPMPAWLATLLASRRGDAESWVVVTRTNRSTDARNLLRVMHRLCDELGLPKTNFRAIRHYAITRMLEAGVPMPEVSRAVGHSSIKITVDTYGHVKPSRAIADALER